MSSADGVNSLGWIGVAYGNWYILPCILETNPSVATNYASDKL